MTPFSSSPGPRELRERFLRAIRSAPVIAGVRDRAGVARALHHGVQLIFYLSGSLFDVEEVAKEVEAAGALLLVHVDLLSGVGKDAEGMRFLARRTGVAGVLSTRSFLLKAAAEAGLLTVQRVFALDSEALHTAVKVIRTTEPTAVEILPGLILPHIVHRLPMNDLPPVIAGGLVEREEQLAELIGAGAIGVSTSRPNLWTWRP